MPTAASNGLMKNVGDQIGTPPALGSGEHAESAQRAAPALSAVEAPVECSLQRLLAWRAVRRPDVSRWKRSSSPA